MDNQNIEILEVLIEIRDTLNRIFICFEDEYIEIQKRKYGEKLDAFEAMLTDVRKKIFLLLCDQKHYSQVKIAQIVGISQPTVSRFVSYLVENGFIEQIEVEDGNIIYRDRYNLLKVLLSKKDG